MEAGELRRLRKAAGLTQAGLAAKLGLHKDFVGQMERGVQRIAERTALAVLAVRPETSARGPSLRLPLITTDPLARIIEAALRDAGIRFQTRQGGGTKHGLDFHLVDFDVAVEATTKLTDRVAEHITRTPDAIVVQGESAVRLLADAIRALASR